jgi:hypothetical protein
MPDVRKNGGNRASAARKNGNRGSEARNGRRASKGRRTGGRAADVRAAAARAAEADRAARELEKVNARITRDSAWLRTLSNDLRRLGEKVYGLTEGTVTIPELKLPLGRYRTPDQTLLEAADLGDAAERLVQVRRRFAAMEKDFASADELRIRMEQPVPSASRRRTTP